MDICGVSLNKQSNEVVTSLLTDYGSPLYVFYEDLFVNNYNTLLDTFRRIYPKYNIAYSYKTNYAPYICKLVKKLGGYAEVVSSMEYWLAKKIGYTSDRIVFNGPVKGEMMYNHLNEGGVVNVDNLDELSRIVEFVKQEDGLETKLAFRVNIDIGQPYISRFGIDANNGDLEQAFRIADEAGIKVVGIHCHIGRSRGIVAWQQRVKVIFDLVDKFFPHPPQFIDLGSGMNSVMEPELAVQFGENIPTYEEYAETVAAAFQQKFGDLPMDVQPELITEPGTTVISGYISFFTRVTSIRMNKGKYIVTLDGSACNIGDICKKKRLPISVFPYSENCDVIENGDFCGYTCLENDVLYRGYTGSLGIGDIVEFRNVGSYSNVFKPPFIAPNCAMVAISADNGIVEIKRRETYEDIFRTYGI